MPNLEDIDLCRRPTSHPTIGSMPDVSRDHTTVECSPSQDAAEADATSSGAVGTSVEIDSTCAGAGFGPLVSFLRRLAAHLAGRRSYLSYGERDAMVAVVAQFDPGYDGARLGEDLVTTNVDLLRLALGQVADTGGRMATFALVATIQLAQADNRLDADDLSLISWVGQSVGVDAEQVGRAIEVVAGRSRPFGPAPVDAI